MFPYKKQLKILYTFVILILLFLTLYLIIKLFPYYQSFFSLLWKLLLPFMIALFIAYLLHPLITKLVTYNMNRKLAILFIYFIFFASIALLIYLVYPRVVVQLRELKEQLPQLFTMYESIIYDLYISTAFLPEIVHDKMDVLITSIENSVEGVIGKLVGGIDQFFNFFIIITVIPVLVFYFLSDYERMKSILKKWIPKRHHNHLHALAIALDERLGGYIRGQLLVSLFVSIVTFMILSMLKIKYALVLSIIMGLTNVIPYFGPIIGAIPAVLITLTISKKLVLLVILAVFFVQIIENNFLSPYIVGKSIRIHPVAIIFALLLGGELGGVVGMIFAVPLLTISNVIFKHISEKQWKY